MCSVVFDTTTPWTVSSVHAIIQARILEWVAISSSRVSFNPGIELMSPVSPALHVEFFTTWATGEAPHLEQIASWTQNIKNGTLITDDAASGMIFQKKTPWGLTTLTSDSASVHLLIKMPGYNFLSSEDPAPYTFLRQALSAFPRKLNVLMCVNIHEHTKSQTRHTRFDTLFQGL